MVNGQFILIFHLICKPPKLGGFHAYLTKYTVQVSLETKVMVNGQVGGEGQETVFLNLLLFLCLDDDHEGGHNHGDGDTNKTFGTPMLWY